MNMNLFLKFIGCYRFLFFLQDLRTMSDPFDRNGLQDYDGLEDEAFPALPPPHSPGLGGHDEGNPFSNGEEMFV